MHFCVQNICTITLGRPPATVGQKFKWVVQARIRVGHGLPGLIKKRSKVKEIIVLIKARSFLDELNLEHLSRASSVAGSIDDMELVMR